MTYIDGARWYTLGYGKVWTETEDRRRASSSSGEPNGGMPSGRVLAVAGRNSETTRSVRRGRSLRESVRLRPTATDTPPGLQADGWADTGRFGTRPQVPGAVVLQPCTFGGGDSWRELVAGDAEKAGMQTRPLAVPRQQANPLRSPHLQLQVSEVRTETQQGPPESEASESEASKLVLGGTAA